MGVELGAVLLIVLRCWLLYRSEVRSGFELLYLRMRRLWHVDFSPCDGQLLCLLFGF